MKALVVTAVVALLIAGARRSTPVAGAPPETEELDRLEKVWNQAHLQGDAEALDRLWADDVLVIVPRMAPLGKADALGALRSGRFKFERYDSSETTTRLYGEVAIVTGRLKRTRHFNERMLDDDWRFTKVYARRGGQWRVVLFHASETGE